MRGPICGGTLCLILGVTGCGAGGGDGGIGFSGSVNEVVLDQSASSPPGRAPGLLARLGAWAFLPEAIAQSEECPADARHVLVCGATLDPDTDCEDLAVTCRPLNASSCRFSVSVVIRSECTGDGRRGFAFPFFVQDVDGDGGFGDGEPSTSSLPFACASEDPNGCSTCNGDAFFWHGVSVDFSSGEAGAAAIEKRRDACGPTPAPSPTATASPTPTATPIL